MNKPQSQHTPGPWYWNEKHQLVSATAREYEWPDDDDVPRKRIVETDGGHYPPHGADRLLIAAAPELLEALLCLMDAFCALTNKTELLGHVTANENDKIYAAIAKATGTP